MKENQRKCLKCESSPSEDPSLKLFRFPQPGIRNTLRCELWAKFCFPEMENRQVCSTEFHKKLYSEHRMLCDKHFKNTSFMDATTKKLHRTAVPDVTPVKKVFVPINVEPVADPSKQPVDISHGTVSRPLADISHSMEAGPSHATVSRSLADISNIMEAGPSHATVSRSLADISHTMVAGPSHSIISQPSHSIQKEVSVKKSKDRYLYIKCRNYMRKICQMKNTLKKKKEKNILDKLQKDNDLQKLMKKITPSLALLLQGEIKNFKRKSKGRRWSKQEKIIALRLYKRSPTCYRLLRRMFCLPATSTLKQILGRFPLKVGINKKVFDMLKKHITTENETDNEYVLAFDEMSIRRHLQYNKKEDVIEGYQDHANQGRSMQIASHALVFMICGIRKKMKQPVAYYLSGSSVTADRLQVLIKEVLTHCFEAGINIAATVCDMDGVNRRALSILGATAQNPNINIFGHDVVTMYDPPHLLKCFRNLFMKYDIKHDTNIISGDNHNQGVAKWSHINEFYRLDNTNPNFVYAPCLKEEHLNPNNKQKMKVKLAAQVLSHSVAAGMFSKIAQGELPLEATVTANLVSKMDNLFDCLNSDCPDLRRGKAHATNLTQKTPHLNLFQDMKKFFENLELVGCKTKPPSIEGWVWTLNAVQIIFNNLKKRHPTIRSLATRRLQQDPLENFFGCVRGHCGSNSNPTAGQFVAGFKTAVLSNLAQLGRGNNCEKDSNEAIIDNFVELLDPIPTPSSQTVLSSSINVGDKTLEDDVAKAFEESSCEGSGEMQACAYVCGFMLKKYSNNCQNCKNILTTEKVVLEHNFTLMKEYNDFKKSLNYASKDLIKCVEYCATAIRLYLEKKSFKIKIKENITESLKKAKEIFQFLNTCPEHAEPNINYIINNVFYITVKRFCILKNRTFVAEASAQALKKKIAILKHI